MKCHLGAVLAALTAWSTVNAVGTGEEPHAGAGASPGGPSHHPHPHSGGIRFGVHQTSNGRYSVVGQHGYPNTHSPGYPSSHGTGYPDTHGSGYPNTHGTGYPNTHGSGYPSTHGSGYPSTHGSGYPNTHSTGYPATHGTTYPNTYGTGYPSYGGGYESSYGPAYSSYNVGGYYGNPYSYGGGYDSPYGFGGYDDYSYRGYDNYGGYDDGYYGGGGGGYSLQSYRQPFPTYGIDYNPGHLSSTHKAIDRYVNTAYNKGKRKLTVDVQYGRLPLKYMYLQQYHGFDHPMAGTPYGPPPRRYYQDERGREDEQVDQRAAEEQVEEGYE